MEEQKNEKKSYNYVTWIVVGIFACVFIGVRIYTKYSQKKNLEIITQHIEKDPDFLYNRMIDMKADKEVRDVEWLEYTCKFGCYFSYPDYFEINETENGASRRVLCQAKGDILTMVQMSCTINPDFKLLSADDKDTRYETAMLDIKASLRENYTKIAFTSVGDDKKRGNLYGKLVKFHAQIQDLPEIEGEVFIAYRNDKLIIYISQVAEGGYKDDLEILIASIVVL